MVPKRKVEKVVTRAEVMTISVTMEESLAIFAYTKVLNHWFSMFQHSWPAMPRPHISSQNAPVDFFFI